MKLKHKLMIGPATSIALLVVCMTATVALTAWAGQRSEAAQALSRERDSVLAQAREETSGLHAALYRSVTLSGSLEPARVKAEVAHVVDAARQHADKVAALARGMGSDGETAKVTQSLHDAVERYAKAAESAVDMASVDVNTGVAALQNCDEALKEVQGALSTMTTLVRQAHQADLADIRDTSLLLFNGMSVGTLVAAVGALVLAWLTQRRVLRDVAEVQHVARQVAEGDLDVAVREDQGRDELGDLMRMQAAMVQRLREIVTEVRSAAMSIQGTCVEVAQGNADLSRRTEQAASRLQETASSMEQLTGTVSQSASVATTAHELAGAAAGAAEQGGNVVGQVVAGMADIANSSNRIVDIVSLIDDIAFQTNLLALNAAVEAARASEHGRGFAVVAGEVRALATRSAGAAREIKELIDNSAEKIESGARLARDAGHAMHDIVSNAKRVSAMLGDMSVTTADQSNGIGLVNRTVSELDQMTQQNAALVEESAAAAESLRQQAERLAEAVSIFKLPADHTVLA